MKIELLLAIIGTFGTMALGINGFFLRGIFRDLNDLKVEFAKMMARSESKTERIVLLEKKTEEQNDSIQNMRDRIHSLEGAQSQVLEYIKNN